MSIVQALMAAANQGQQEDSGPENVRDWAVNKIAAYKTHIAKLEKLIAEVDAIGADRIHRITQLAAGVDPDAPKSTLKVGPHGPGCECLDPQDEDSCASIN